jgi:hypothetical protein
MTDVSIHGDFKGVKGEFKLKTSFPVILKECESHIDKIKSKKTITYVEHHGEKEGNTSVSVTKVERA